MTEIMDDHEAAKLFGIALSTLRQHCMADFTCPSGKVDVRKAKPVIVGRSRRWRRSAIMEVLATTP